MKVMFIDDAPEVLDGLRRAFRRYRTDWEMSFHDDPVVALAELHANPGQVVVTDWMMPGLTGLELCRSIQTPKEPDSRAQYYVIILTGKQDVAAAVGALDEGADDFVRKPFDSKELAARIRTGIRVLESEQRLQSANERLFEMANTDALTGLLNRLRGNVIIENELSRASRGVESLMIALLDLDYFKRINDAHGHNAGDEVLKAVSDRLRKDRREYDAVVRWGGEEFLVLLPHATKRDAQSIGERLCLALSHEPVILESGLSLEITASIGLAITYRETNLTSTAFIDRADRALYRAKEGGRDQCVLFDE